MKQRNLASLLLAGAMTAALLTGPAQAAESPSPQEIAAAHLQAEGLMNGDEHGDLHLDKGLTRAELACLISPIVLNPEHVAWERDYIQAIYPFPDKAAVVCNEEGKNLGLPFNRPLFDENDLPYDIICGTFFVAGLGVEDFVSLTEEQIRRYKEHYDRVMVLTAAKETTPQHKPPHPHKYRRGVER